MIKIYGASDDLVEIEGDVSDEIGANQPITIGDAERGGVVVTMHYTKEGVWKAALRQIDDGVSIPWPVRIENAEASGYPDPRTYSVLVVIQSPPGTTVRAGRKVLCA